MYMFHLFPHSTGESLSAALVFETSLVNFLSYPWAGTLVSIVPSNVCAEPGLSTANCVFCSFVVLYLLMPF